MYEVTEVCPNCEKEVTMVWDVETYGYRAYCPFCGKRLMLCDMCQHPNGEEQATGDCDYDSRTDTCRFNRHEKRETNREKAFQRFHSYWKDLYGEGLSIVGWNLNGELEPFEHFFDSAEEYMNLDVDELWHEFGDIPMNPETECIEYDWRDFPAGTHREDIWHWFEETFGVRVHDLMY